MLASFPENVNWTEISIANKHKLSNTFRGILYPGRRRIVGKILMRLPHLLFTSRTSINHLLIITYLTYETITIILALFIIKNKYREINLCNITKIENISTFFIKLKKNLIGENKLKYEATLITNNHLRLVSHV